MCDKIFLLNSDEAERLFADDYGRMCKLTAYAVKNGAWTPSTGEYAGKARWWLRSGGRSNGYAVNVGYDGIIGINGSNVDYKRGAVRPAFLLAIHPICKVMEDCAKV